MCDVRKTITELVQRYEGFRSGDFMQTVQCDCGRRRGVKFVRFQAVESGSLHTEHPISPVFGHHPEVVHGPTQEHRLLTGQVKVPIPGLQGRLPGRHLLSRLGHLGYNTSIINEHWARAIDILYSSVSQTFSPRGPLAHGQP